MGTHAKPRRRVRSAALGTLAVGATLTGVGLTAAALDPSGASLADGSVLGTAPVNFAASGLGAPVPVADVSSVVGNSGASGAKTGNAVKAVNGDAPAGEYAESGKTVRSRVSNAAGRAGSSKRSGTVRSTSVKSSSSSAVASTSQRAASQGARSANPASGDGATSGYSATSDSGGAATRPGSGVAKPSTQLPSLPLTLPSLPHVDTSLPLATTLPVPSLPTVSSLSATVNQAKSTVARLLDQVAGYV